MTRPNLLFTTLVKQRVAQALREGAPVSRGSRLQTRHLDRCDNSNSTALEERSWAGVGWRLHFGRILHADSQSAGQIQIEMGDGSRHALYHSQGNPNIW